MGAARDKLATRGLQAAMGAGRQRNLRTVLLPHARVLFIPRKTQRDRGREREGERERERERERDTEQEGGRAGGWEGGREGGRGGIYKRQKRFHHMAMLVLMAILMLW